MNNILDTIIAYKRKEVAERKARISLADLEARPFYRRECRSLVASLKDKKKTGIIAEFKRCSPSKGWINIEAEVETITTQYAQYGASGLSVLTDQEFFKGRDEDLQCARALNQIPILRKDFVIDPYQIKEAKSLGADVILLIAECLEREEVSALADLAGELGMEVLLELHSEMQLDKFGPGINIAGINNRDLKTFKVDIAQSIRLAGKLPEDICKVAESGINDPEVVAQLKKEGFDGFLIGEYFMKQQDPGEAFRVFAEKARQIGV